MDNADSDDLAPIAQEVGKICEPFLKSRGLSFFQFKRVFKDNSFMILANNTAFFKNFLEKDLSEFLHHIPFDTRQLAIYSWDDASSKMLFPLLDDQRKAYHALTFISRRKHFCDFVTFARSKAHPLPSSYYFYLMKDLQKFVEIFPVLAQNLIEKSKVKSNESSAFSGSLKRKGFFLPKRSNRFRIGEGAKDYITTYEAFCLHLLQEGKSYKEIGSVLSMSANTVETHLTRLKARTGLTFQELSLRALETFNGKKKNLR